MIATSTIVAVLISVLGGAAAGALSRQPEINRLKAQVRKLQAEVERLQNIIRTQDRQIKTLMVKYKGLKAYQFSARNKARNYTRGALIFQYAYKEYLGLLMRTVDSGTVKLSQEETIFFNIFDKVIDGQKVEDSEKEGKRTIITRPEQSYGRVPLAGLCRLFISVYVPGAGLPGARASAFPAPHGSEICPNRAAYSAPAIDTHKAQCR